MSTSGGSLVGVTTALGQLITLPPGVTILPGRESSWTDQQGTVVQGMVFGVKLGNGTTTTVYVPYSEIQNTQAVEAIINARVHAIQAITG